MGQHHNFFLIFTTVIYLSCNLIMWDEDAAEIYSLICCYISKNLVYVLLWYSPVRRKLGYLWPANGLQGQFWPCHPFCLGQFELNSKFHLDPEFGQGLTVHPVFSTPWSLIRLSWVVLWMRLLDMWCNLWNWSTNNWTQTSHVYSIVYPYYHRDVDWIALYHCCNILHFVWSSVQEVPFEDQLLEKDGSGSESQHRGKVKLFL